MESKLYAGFARCNITPSIGTPIRGYYIERKVEGVLDELEVNAVVLKKDKDLAIIMSVDNCGLVKEKLDLFREKISEKTGVSADAVFIHATHTHTGPGASILYGENEKILQDYWVSLERKCIDAAYLAIQDLKPAKIGYGIGEAKKVAFIRRFRMKDGSIMTNPGVNNPDIQEPIGEVDERVNVLRIDREGADSIILANFANHPDTVGGNLISADWPGFARRFVEKSIENTKCICLNGAQGDVNHVNVHPVGGDFNDMFHDFDGCSRGYGHARHIGRVVAGAVMQVYDKVCYVKTDDICFIKENVEVPSQMPTAEDLPLAKKYLELHNAGLDSEIPYQGMMLTTVIAEAERMLRLEHGPTFFTLPISVVKIGKIAFVGLPGEPFTGVGRAIKETEGFDLVFPCCCTNDFAGYFPMAEAYEEGGYESRSSIFKVGVAEKVIDKAKELLKRLQ